MKYFAASTLALCAALTSCARGGDVPESCSGLLGTQFDAATIENTEWISRGDPLLPLFRRALVWVMTRGGLELNAPVDFCHVTAKARPAPGSEITIEVWLPESWKGKLLGVGGAGFNGSGIAAGFFAKDNLAQGYAVVSTDAGHEATDSAKFAYDSEESLKDYGYRANHLGAQFAKALAAAYYAKPVQRAYFQGCSNGGRDALMVAQRFPEDYDGILAGAPAADFSGVMSRFVWNRIVVEGAPKLGDKLQLVHGAIMAKCDALDGVQDGLLENPLACGFDPAELRCKNGEGPDCLNAAEVDVLQKVYAGPRLPDGTQVYAGQPVGAETVEGGWDGWITGEVSDGGPEFFRWMVYRDPAWEISRFDLARDSALAKERVGPIVDANPDLSAFMRRGGKLMLYHGWNDAAIPAGATLDYYASMRKAVGAAADQQVRLFMVPGLAHCWGGPGPTFFDKMAEMERWVESGVAPDRIVATEYDPPVNFFPLAHSKKVRTRPLCPWPTVARYKGSGSTDDAASFACQ